MLCHKQDVVVFGIEHPTTGTTPTNSWVLLISHKHEEISTNKGYTMTISDFRRCLHYINNMGTLEQVWKEYPITEKQRRIHTFDNVQVSSLTKCGSTYRVELSSHYCECPSWKYRRNKYRNKDCKHIMLLRPPVTTTLFGFNDINFHPISNTIPKKQCIFDSWLYSRKFDGIRIKLRGCMGYTKHITIDLTTIWPHEEEEYEYDAELCMNPTDNCQGHDAVMGVVHSGKLDRLCIRVFDIIPRTDEQDRLVFTERVNLINKLFLQKNIPHDNIVRYKRCSIHNNTGFLTYVYAYLDKHQDVEGFVVRNPISTYSHIRRNTDSFKIKRTVK